MKRLLFFVFFFPFCLNAQDWRYAKGKKLFTNLAEAIANKDSVYSLLLYGREAKAEMLHLIGSMKNLQYLAIDHAGIDSLPDAVLNLPNIRTLSLCNNDFKRLPTGIRKLKALEYLAAYDNEITEVPDWIGELSNLETLILPRNKIAYLSAQIKCLQKLQDLSLGDNKLQQLPDEIGDLASLKELSLHENLLTVLPQTIVRLANLESLELNKNKLERLPDNFGDLKNVKYLHLDENHLQRLPSSFNNLTSLIALGLADNPLEAWPSEIHFGKNLEHLRFSGEKLLAFPASMQDCRKLEHIEVTNTSVSVVPEWLGSLVELIWLEFNNNKITSLPFTLDRLKKLEVLWLHNNNKLDTFPGGLLKLPKLRVVYVDDNPVRHIPQQLMDASPSLETFGISKTKITYEEYKRFRKSVRKKIEIPHDKPYYFEDEDKPCYADLPGLSVPEEFDQLRINPEFWGGRKAWQDFVSEHLDKMKIASLLSNQIDSVTVQFLVKKKGGIGNAKATGRNGALCDEALRIIRLSCRYWTPPDPNGIKRTVWTQQRFVFQKGEANGTLFVRVFNPYLAEPKIFLHEE